MAKITDIFVKRPILSSVVSLLIFLVGLLAVFTLPLREFPELSNTVISITTAFPGADADLIQGYITTPIQTAVASAPGIDYMEATSQKNVSIIKAHIKLSYEPEKAFSNIMSKVAEVRNRLPQEAEQPVLKQETGTQIALMYIGFKSNVMTGPQITDYITRVVRPSIETVSGVSKAEIFGSGEFAMRIWLDPQKLAAHNLTPVDISNSLRSKNFLTAAGVTKGKYTSINVSASTDLHTAEEFKKIIIKRTQSGTVHLEEVATIEIGAQNYDSSVIFNGQKAIFVGVFVSPTGNPLSVIGEVRNLIPQLQKGFPPSLEASVAYDATRYISSSIHEVIKTLLEATVIVVLVIYLFLGSLRSVLIPLVTIPLSLIGVCSLLLLLGYSINLLTLLAMVLAIGLVVDDAIVVVENIHRHLEEGLTPFNAALIGAREIMTPVIAMTITLAAVYAPIGFTSGLTGALFKEFAFTLAGAVIVSGVIALTLSPMMCSLILISEKKETGYAVWLDEFFAKVKLAYQNKLQHILAYRPVILLMGSTLLVGCYFLYNATPRELAPEEDQSIIFMSATAPESANSDYVSHFSEQFYPIFDSMPEKQDYFLVNGMGSVNNVIAGLLLKPWEERARKQKQVTPELQHKLGTVAGLNTVAFALPPLPIGDDSLPVNFVITTIEDNRLLNDAAQELMIAAKQSGLFIFADSSLKFNKPETKLVINRDKAADLGISMSDIGAALSVTLSEGYVNRYSMQGRSYDVIPQLPRGFRARAEQLRQIYIRTESGKLVPLSTIATLAESVLPNSLSQFQQLNSARISGMLMPGVSLGEGLQFLSDKATEILPKGMSFDYAGQSRSYIQEGNTLLYAFLFSIIFIFLILSAQFESFRNSLVIMVSVPMSICGALLFLFLGFATINIYTQIGLITLVGLISKHGILMVDFANHLRREEKLSVHSAIVKAAGIRLRPILMTTAAMVVGVVPLLIASGAGANSRHDIGLVIFTGMTIGTIFTLFVVPTIYTYLSSAEAREI
jgi:multidrug efflux pump